MAFLCCTNRESITKVHSLAIQVEPIGFFVYKSNASTTAIKSNLFIKSRFTFQWEVGILKADEVFELWQAEEVFTNYRAS